MKKIYAVAISAVLLGALNFAGCAPKGFAPNAKCI